MPYLNTEGPYNGVQFQIRKQEQRFGTIKLRSLSKQISYFLGVNSESGKSCLKTVNVFYSLDSFFMIKKSVRVKTRYDFKF